MGRHMSGIDNEDVGVGRRARRIRVRHCSESDARVICGDGSPVCVHMQCVMQGPTLNCKALYVEGDKVVNRG